MMTESSGRVSRHKSKAHRTHTDLKDYDIGFPQSVEEIESVQSRMVHLVESLERGEQSMVNNHRYVINDTIRKMVSFPDPFDKKQFLLTRKDLEEKKHLEENKCENEIVNIEKQIDEELINLRRAYLKGAVNLHLHKPADVPGGRSDSSDQMWSDFRQSSQKLASCKRYLISGTSSISSIDDSSNPTFHKVWNIKESFVQCGQGRFASEHPEFKDGLLGTGPHGTQVFAGDVQGDSIVIKKFSTPIAPDRIAKLKDLESHKSLLLIRGVIVPNDPLAKSQVNSLIVSLCARQDLEKVYKTNMHAFSFSRKMKWANSIALGLEWIHVRKPQILHSRLKPANLLVTSDWKIKLSDYGQGYVAPQTEAEKFFVAPELLESGNETEKADVYSYGAILWYIFTEKKRKWADLSWDMLRKQLQNRDASCLPDSLPKDMQDLIFRCCSPKEAERPSFNAILSDTKWNEIIMEALNKGQREATDVWKQAQGNRDVVEFENLVDVYLKKFMPEIQVTEKTLQEDAVWRCLALFLDVTDNNRIVTEESWQKLLHFFKPLGRETTAKLTNLLKQPWFFGDISGDDACDVLSSCFIREGGVKKMKGKFRRFIVRFSANTAEGDEKNATKNASIVKYSVTYFNSSTMEVNANGKPQPTHMRLPNINSADHLIKWVEDHFVKGDWKPAEGVRKYAACFTKFMGQGGYGTSHYQAPPTQKEESKGTRVFGAGTSGWDEKIAHVEYIH